MVAPCSPGQQGEGTHFREITIVKAEVNIEARRRLYRQDEAKQYVCVRA